MPGLPADYFPIEIVIEPKSKAVAEALPALLEASGHDIRIETNFETGQVIIAGRSEAQLRQVVRRIEDATDSCIHVGEPQVLYCERLGCPAEVDFTHKKQAAGTGSFARIKLLFEPLHAGAGFVFENRIVGGAVPETFIPAVEKGLEAARQNGLLAGYPVIDFRAVLLDGAYHDLDSTPLSFEIAARGAFRQLRHLAEPCLAQPVVDIDVAVPDALAGAVCSVMGARGLTEILPMKREAGAPLRFHGWYIRALGVEDEMLQRTGGAAQLDIRCTGLDTVPSAPAGGDDDTFPPAIGMRA
ncbi:MAG: hypothetical protein KDA53_12180 [Hyphomonas sp.]|nr:hypothetical protein [Hyphomonas sp.]